MKYKIYYLRDRTALLLSAFKTVELDEIHFKDRDNLFDTMEEAHLYILSCHQQFADNTFTILPFIKK